MAMSDWKIERWREEKRENEQLEKQRKKKWGSKGRREERANTNRERARGQLLRMGLAGITIFPASAKSHEMVREREWDRERARERYDENWVERLRYKIVGEGEGRRGEGSKISKRWWEKRCEHEKSREVRNKRAWGNKTRFKATGKIMYLGDQHDNDV